MIHFHFLIDKYRTFCIFGWLIILVGFGNGWVGKFIHCFYTIYSVLLSNVFHLCQSFLFAIYYYQRLTGGGKGGGVITFWSHRKFSFCLFVKKRRNIRLKYNRITTLPRAAHSLTHELHPLCHCKLLLFVHWAFNKGRRGRWRASDFCL